MTPGRAYVSGPQRLARGLRRYHVVQAMRITTVNGPIRHTRLEYPVISRHLTFAAASKAARRANRKARITR